MTEEERMLKKISFAMLFIYIIISTVGGLTFAATTADEAVGVEIVSEYSNLLKDDVLEVYVRLTGLQDEIADDFYLHFFEFHLNFDSAALEFIPNDAEENASEFCINTTAQDTQILQVAENKDVIVVVFESANNIDLSSAAQTGELDLAKVCFKVKGSDAAETTVAFDDAYTSVTGYVLDGTEKVRSFSCTNGDDLTFSLGSYLIIDESAQIDAEGNIKDTVSAGADVGSGILIAKLYEVESGSLVKPPVIVPTVNGRIEISESETLFTEVPEGSYKIDYFFWQGFANIKPIKDKITVNVTAAQ